MPAHASARSADPAAARPRRAVRILLTTVVALLLAAALGVGLWARPFPPTPAALDTIAHPPGGVRIEDAAGSVALLPASERDCGLVFQPGARVDPRAYVRLLAPVAEAGCVVEIVRQPLGVGLLATDAPAPLMGRHPAVTTWTVGGHSLGGVAASDYVTAHPDGPRRLLLWASYPRTSLADRADLRVVSLAGGEDGLATPEKMAAAAPLLPTGTTVTTIPGGNHSAFGDYGEQPGDHPLTAERTRVQDEIVRRTVELVRG